MISAQDITLQYGGRVLFKDVNVNFTKGNCYGLIGANGTGKSTFLKLMIKEEEPSSGKILIDNKDIGKLKQKEVPFLRR